MKSDCANVTYTLSEMDISETPNKNGETSENIENKCTTTYKLVGEEAVSLNKNYILFLDGTKSSKIHVGVGLSDKSCRIYSVDESSLNKIHEIKSHQDGIVGVKFSHENSQLFFSGSNDGVIKLWDLRQPLTKSSLEFKESDKALTCFDLSKNDRLLSGGTELIGGDSFILFWDIRSSNLLGGYWESHTDDITQVKFHKTNSDLLASGSTDGLVNVFDLSESQEDDALLYTFNTNSSVEQIQWFLSHNKKDAIGCTTHTNILQLWQIEDDDFYVDFSRESISQALVKKVSMDDCYVANFHGIADGELLVLAGSNVGKGEFLQTLKVKNSSLISDAQFLENKQIVRSSWFCEEDNLMVTGGESGILSLWKPGHQSSSSINTNSKSESSLKHKRTTTKPY